MSVTVPTSIGRRAFVTQAAVAAGLFALSGCATVSEHSYERAVRRLLTLATQNAFARLTEPEGFWDSTVARIELPVLFGRSSSAARGILTSQPFREQLQYRINRIAEDGARRAAPLVADAVMSIGIADARAIIVGGPTAATTLLRREMGSALANAMIPELDRVMRTANDPIVGQAISALAGVDIADAAHALALAADNAIWYEIGAAERRVRENPESTGDPILTAVLRGV